MQDSIYHERMRPRRNIFPQYIVDPYFYNEKLGLQFTIEENNFDLLISENAHPWDACAILLLHSKSYIPT